LLRSGSEGLVARREFLLHVKEPYKYENREPGSSVSIVSGYGLDDRAIVVRSPAGAEDFSSSLCV
jgi:hypothetical protein